MLKKESQMVLKCNNVITQAIKGYDFDKTKDVIETIINLLAISKHKKTTKTKTWFREKK